jgi:hypothetical protein
MAKETYLENLSKTILEKGMDTDWSELHQFIYVQIESGKTGAELFNELGQIWDDIINRKQHIIAESFCIQIFYGMQEWSKKAGKGIDYGTIFYIWSITCLYAGNLEQL